MKRILPALALLLMGADREVKLGEKECALVAAVERHCAGHAAERNACEKTGFRILRVRQISAFAPGFLGSDR